MQTDVGSWEEDSLYESDKNVHIETNVERSKARNGPQLERVKVEKEGGTED